MAQRIEIDQHMTQRIRQARTKSDLSQGDLAKKARVPRARIKRIECNELATIDTAEYERINKALGIAAMVKKQKTPAKPKVSSKKATAPITTGKRKATRRAVLRLLEEAGVLDMTLRELIS